jgi:hypothetical protein
VQSGCNLHPWERGLSELERGGVLIAARPNFVKISGAHRMPSAMAAGVESRLWEIGDIVKVVEAWEAALG